MHYKKIIPLALVTMAALVLLGVIVYQTLIKPSQFNVAQLENAILLDEAKPIENFQIKSGDQLIQSDELLEEKIALVYFGYSFCPDICPLSLAEMGAALGSLEKTHPTIAEKVVLLFISVDPQRDTPQRTKQYAEFFHPKMIGGNWVKSADIQDLNQFTRQFAAYFEIEDHQEGEDYLVSHTGHIVLLRKKENNPLQYIGIFGDGHNAQNIKNDLAVLVNLE